MSAPKGCEPTIYTAGVPIEWTDKVPPDTRRKRRLTGRDAWQHGYDFAKRVKASNRYSNEDIRLVVERSSLPPMDDYDKGFVKGLME